MFREGADDVDTTAAGAACVDSETQTESCTAGRVIQAGRGGGSGVSVLLADFLLFGGDASSRFFRATAVVSVQNKTHRSQTRTKHSSTQPSHAGGTYDRISYDQHVDTPRQV